MNGKKILVIDDDINLCQIIKYTFKSVDIAVVTAVNGQEGLRQFYAHHPNLVLLDIRMPIMDGWETCREIRKLSNVPIIMLTTLHRDEEAIRGFNCGADDFVNKPFNSQVLLARVQAALRRADLPNDDPKPISYSDNYLVVDLERRRVLKEGKSVKLSAREFDLLSYLLINAGRVLTYQQILDKVWGWEYRDNVEYIHVYLSHLRRKLEQDPKNPTYFVTEHGVGYRFEKPTAYPPSLPKTQFTS
ncbi:MAG: response regulator transcription factor [Chloroflexi bacterium]|nr:response regulator transcription factor [Chloroflexota bacterium]